MTLPNWRRASRSCRHLRAALLANIAIGLAVTASGGQAYGASAPMPPPPVLTKDQALVYIHRSRSTALAARGVGIYIDNVKATVLGYNGCTMLIVSPGDHVLKDRWPLDLSYGRSDSGPVHWEAGKTYYYRFQVGMHSNYQIMTFEWGFLSLDAQDGPQEISDCRYTPSVNGGVLTTTPSETGAPTQPVAPSTAN